MSLAAANEISAESATAAAVLSELDGFFFFAVMEYSPEWRTSLVTAR